MYMYIILIAVNRLKSFNKKCKVLDKDFAFYKVRWLQ